MQIYALQQHQIDEFKSMQLTTKEVHKITFLLESRGAQGGLPVNAVLSKQILHVGRQIYQEGNASYAISFS